MGDHVSITVPTHVAKHVRETLAAHGQGEASSDACPPCFLMRKEIERALRGVAIVEALERGENA